MLCLQASHLKSHQIKKECRENQHGRTQGVPNLWSSVKFWGCIVSSWLRKKLVALLALRMMCVNRLTRIQMWNLRSSCKNVDSQWLRASSEKIWRWSRPDSLVKWFRFSAEKHIPGMVRFQTLQSSRKTSLEHEEPITTKIKGGEASTRFQIPKKEYPKFQPCVFCDIFFFVWALGTLHPGLLKLQVTLSYCCLHAKFLGGFSQKSPGIVRVRGFLQVLLKRSFSAFQSFEKHQEVEKKPGLFVDDPTTQLTALVLRSGIQCTIHYYTIWFPTCQVRAARIYRSSSALLLLPSWSC